MTLARAVLEGNRLALARLLTQIENDTPEGRAAVGELFPHTGRAHLIGVTGAPGTGKSSLVNHLARVYRQPPAEAEPPLESEPRKVAIVAVDPSSPFTGGAILGDRVRMRDLAGDPGVFIRSMASRGSLGGLAAATSGVVLALDAAGYDVILIETVGAGQAEVDIARLAHTTLVIEAPGLGDEIQAIKAGILEIADVLVVNKADRPGVEATERALRSMLQLAHPVPHVFQNHHRPEPGHTTQDLAQAAAVEEDMDREAHDVAMWLTPIQRTVATEGTGVPELAQAIARHYQYLQETGELARRDRTRLQSELDMFLRETLVSRWRATVSPQRYDQALVYLVQRKISPWQAAVVLLDGGEYDL